MEAELELKKVAEIKGDLQSVRDKILKLSAEDGLSIHLMTTVLESYIVDMEAAEIGLIDFIKLNQE